MLPGLVATRKDGSKIVFDTRDISETPVVNTGQLLRLSRLSGVDEKTRVRFAQMFTKLQALGAQIGNQIRGLEPGARICSASICSR